MGVDYAEYEGSPIKEVWLRDGFHATRELLCAWDDRDDLVQEIVDNNQAYPLLLNSGAVAVTARARPFRARMLNTGDTKEAAYDKAIVTIDYEPETIILDDESFEPTGEHMILSREEFQWVSDNEPLVESENPAKFVPGMDYVVTRRDIATLGVDIRGFIGKVNDRNIIPTSPGLGGLVFHEECLLFNPPTIVRVTRPNITTLWDLTFRFTDKPNWDETATPHIARGWNWQFRPNVVGVAGTLGKFDQIKDSAGNVYKSYPTANFAKL